MLVKGHDFPKVTLVVIILADALFRFPDFRAAERALQMLTQVSGRAGRGETKGEVLIQTYQPEHPVIQVLKHELDEDAFLETERELRKELAYPPFARMARLRIEDSESENAKKASIDLARALERFSDEERSKNASLLFDVLGPSEAFLEKAKGIYRFDILLKCSQIQTLQTAIRSAKDFSHAQGRSLLVDVDPYGLG